MSYFKLSNFTSHLGPVIMGRAREYWQQKRARLVNQLGNAYEYEVEGTKKYLVRLVIDDNGRVDYSCNCPYSWGPCKHIGAALLQHTRGDSDTYIARKQAELDAKTKAKEEAIKAKCHNSWGITDDALYLLCQMAYGCIRVRGSEDLRRLDGKTFTPGAMRECLKEFRKHHWVCGEQTSFGYDCALEPTAYFQIMEELFLHPDWQETMSKFVVQYTHSIFLRECAEILFGKRDTFSYVFTRQFFTRSQWEWVIEVLVGGKQYDQFEQLLAQLNPDFLADVLGELLHDAYLAQDVTVMEMIGRTLDTYAVLPADLRRVSAEYKKDYFYYQGVELPARKEDEKFSSYCYLQASRALYEDQLDVAIKRYEEGIKRQGKESGQKYVPSDPISFLLYVVALARRHSEVDMQQLRTIASKEQKIDSDLLQTVFALVDFFKDSDQYVDEAGLRFEASLDADVEPVNVVISYLLLRFFQKDTDELKLPNVRCAVLQRELAAYADIPTGSWPYESVLSKLRIRPTWEVKLQELIHETSGVIVGTETPDMMKSETRLCYFLKYSDYVEVREQNVLKSGAWGKGKTVSMVRYHDGDVEMDDIDRKIHSEWMNRRGRYEYFPKLPLILPFLKGTDKLIQDERNGYTVVSVVEELPYIYTEKKGGKIFFQTNVPEDAMREDDGLWYARGNGKVTYYPISASVRDYFLRIIQLGAVPEEAEPMLEQLFSGLKGRVEIQSEIRGAVQLETVDGQSLPIMQIQPDGQHYMARMVVRPLDGGDLLCQPGKGKEIVVDRADGVRYNVQRSLRTEKRMRDKLLQAMSEHIEVPVSVSDEYPLTMVELLMVLEMVQQQPELCAVEWPKEGKIKIRPADASTWNISATAKGGWFELDGEFALSEDKIVNMSQLLGLLRENTTRYVRLGEDEYVTLSDELRRQLMRIDAMAQESHGHVRIPELTMAVAGDALHGDIDIAEPKRLLELRKKIRESERMTFAIPDMLNATLRDYQEDGYRWMMRLMSWGAGACLADDMGLGKTVQTIACLLAHADKGPQLVVAPASVVLNWQRELARFAPSMTVFMLNEIAVADRAEFIRHLDQNDVMVLTYGLLVTEREVLTEREWVTVCLDEAHTIKNRDTKASAAAMQLRALNRLILTGTPIQNHLGELWNLMQFINPGLLGSYEHFSQRFITPISAGEEEPKQQLKRMIAPFMLRRTKQQVVRELPDKEEIRVLIQLSDEEMAVYEVIRREAKAELESSATLSVNALSMITKLREAACSAALAEKKWKGSSSKLEALTDKLIPIVEGGNKVLVFSQFTSFLQMAREAVEKAGVQDYFYLDGSTPIRERQRMVEAFQRGEKAVFFISLKAGGLGLNLTGANYVIHLDPWWNPAIEQQATDRAYRIGQQQKVTVYHLISEHTIEEKILRLHESKRSLADSLLEGTDMSHKLTAKDMLELLEG